MRYTEPELSTSALLTIDFQCDFVMPGAVAEIPGSYDVVPNMKSVLMMFRLLKRPIIHIVRLYRPDGSNDDLCRKSMVEEGTRLVAPHSSGADLADALKPNQEVQLDAGLLLQGGVQQWAEAEYVIYKPRWGAFYRTPLHQHLKTMNVDTLVFCGCNYPNCPRTSVYEASERDYRIILIEDAVSGIYEQGKTELRNIGVRVWSTQKLLDELGNEHGPFL